MRAAGGAADFGDFRLLAIDRIELGEPQQRVLICWLVALRCLWSLVDEGRRWGVRLGSGNGGKSMRRLADINLGSLVNGGWDKGHGEVARSQESGVRSQEADARGDLIRSAPRDFGAGGSGRPRSRMRGWPNLLRVKI